VAALKGAAESLLLPLCSRALETARERPLLRDEKAAQILQGLDYDVAPLRTKTLYHTIICLRTRRFDAAVAEFLQEHPVGTIVSLGCGLDTRFERVDNGRARWLEVDLPEVIELRRKFLDENPRRRFVGASVTDLSWVEVLREMREGPVFFFAEGLFMFLSEADVRGVVVAVANGFPGGRLLFDAVKPIEIVVQRLHPTLSRTGARLRWGLRGAQVVEAWHPALRLEGQWYYCEEAEARLGWYRLLRYVPVAGRTAWILRVRF
jgi:methyltransferase (TIGR00027 family)